MATFFLIVLSAGLSLADVQLYPNTTLITSNVVSSACLKAMNATIACDPYLVSLASTNYYGSLNDDNLQSSVCSTACGTALSTYHNSVVSSCANDPKPWNGVPANYYGDLVWAQYNLTCIKDPETHQWCSDYISNITFPSADSELTSLPKDQLCSPCITALAAHMQSTAFSNYDSTLATQWQSIQSTCGLDLPTNPQPPVLGNNASIPGYVQSGTTQPKSCISDSTYTVVSGDDLEKIAAAKGVSSGTLRILNDILPDGSNLWAGMSLCLPQPCQTYSVKGGDTCAAIAVANGISYSQFLAYNPSINGECTNLLSDTHICVGLPGATWTGTTIEGATVTKTTPYASSTIAPPTNVATGTTRKCGKFYTVQPGDICQKVALNNTIDLSLFEAINPSIDDQCSNLIAGVAYCVFPTQDWNATTTVTVAPPAPTPSGSTGSCYEWHKVVDEDYCYAIEQTYGITFDQFKQWNPSIDDDCNGLILGDAYCVSGPSASPAAKRAVNAATVTSKPNAKRMAELEAYIRMLPKRV